MSQPDSQKVSYKVRLVFTLKTFSVGAFLSHICRSTPAASKWVQYWQPKLLRSWLLKRFFRLLLSAIDDTNQFRSICPEKKHGPAYMPAPEIIPGDFLENSSSYSLLWYWCWIADWLTKNFGWNNGKESEKWPQTKWMTEGRQYLYRLWGRQTNKTSCLSRWELIGIASKIVNVSPDF